MKIVIFAHVPPPLHGQSYMVKLMLDGLGGDNRKGRRSRHAGPVEAAGIECFHVNAQFSSALGEVGTFQVLKVFRLLRYCVEAVWCRFRFGADVLYYVPAPPKRVPFYRDCLVLGLCRPFFRRMIFHWEASGLGEWLEQDATSWERALARCCMGSPGLSVTLAAALETDARHFRSERVRVAANGIPDPCPDFETALLPMRMLRLAERRRSFNSIYRVVFLAHCTHEKGLFDALEAIAFANRQPGVRMELFIGGAFLNRHEREEFDTWQKAHPGMAVYLGFLDEAAKTRLLRESDCLCFPSYYSAEAQPVSIVEAMAFGMAVVASDWRGIPELLPPDYPFLIPPRDPAACAHALVESMRADVNVLLRERYREFFTAERYVENLRQAFELLGD